MKTIKRSFLFCMLTCLMILVIPTSARAATASLTTLKNNKTYSSYDVTRDGKKDKIKIVETGSTTTTLTTRKVYVNGKYRFKAEAFKGCFIYVFRSGTKSVIVCECVAGDGGHIISAYQYSGGKFKKKELGPNTMFYTDVKRSGSYLKLISEPKHPGWTMSFSNYTQMPFKVVDTYKMSNGLLVKTSTYASVTGKTSYYAKSTFTTGKTPASVGKKDGPKVRAGSKVTLKSFYYRKSDHYYYYKISAGGKTGWFKDSIAIQFRSA